MSTRQCRLALAWAAFALTACDSPPTGPRVTDPLAATWAGTILDERNGSGTMRLKITGDQGSRAPMGDWSVTFASGWTVAGTAPPYSAQGDGSIIIFGSCGSGSVGFQLALEGSTLKGKYAAVGACPLSLGTLSLAKP